MVIKPPLMHIEIILLAIEGFILTFYNFSSALLGYFLNNIDIAVFGEHFVRRTLRWRRHFEVIQIPVASNIYFIP